MPIRRIRIIEEIVNAITHGIGLLLSVSALTILIMVASMKGNALHIVSVSIFGASLIILYLSSTLYHSTFYLKFKRIFQRFDHITIYYLIAGSYTPFALVTLRGAWGWTIFGCIWGLAIIGTFGKIFFMGKYPKLSALLYLLMGWFIVIAIKPLVQYLPMGGLIWLFTGGLFYSFGIVFFLWEKLPFSHGVWHLFVLGGSICHFFAILFYVLPI